MSVYAHDELLRQSLQQSLCPNEKEFCSFIQSFIYFIFWFSLLASYAPDTQGVTKQEGLMTVIPLCQGRLDMLPSLAQVLKRGKEHKVRPSGGMECYHSNKGNVSGYIFPV